jgi:Tfp pilus assembly protein PilV
MRRRGFGLVEALVAVGLLTMTLIFLLELFPTVRRGLVQSSQRTRAAERARGLLEQACAREFSQLASESGGDYQLQVETVESGKKLVWVTVSGLVTLETLVVELP